MGEDPSCICNHVQLSAVTAAAHHRSIEQMGAWAAVAVAERSGLVVAMAGTAMRAWASTGEGESYRACVVAAMIEEAMATLPTVVCSIVVNVSAPSVAAQGPHV